VQAGGAVLVPGGIAQRAEKARGLGRHRPRHRAI
jgi:hypothetical protein